MIFSVTIAHSRMGIARNDVAWLASMARTYTRFQRGSFWHQSYSGPRNRACIVSIKRIPWKWEIPVRKGSDRRTPNTCRRMISTIRTRKQPVIEMLISGTFKSHLFIMRPIVRPLRLLQDRRFISSQIDATHYLHSLTFANLAINIRWRFWLLAPSTYSGWTYQALSKSAHLSFQH